MTLRINLLPWRETLKETQKNEYLLLLATAVISVAVLLFLLHIWVGEKIDDQHDSNQYLKSQIAIFDQKIAEIEVIEKAKRELLAKMDIIQQLQASRPEVVQLFDGIVRIVPTGLFLTNLSRTGMKIQIDGKAESNTRVSTFMRNIEATKWLKTPDLSLIQADEKEDDKEKNNVNKNTGDRLIGFNLQAIEVMTNTQKSATPVTQHLPGGAQ